MTWADPYELFPAGTGPRISASIAVPKLRSGSPYLTISINKTAFYNMQLKVGDRVEVKIGQNDDYGKIRMKFGVAGGSHRLQGAGGSGNKGAGGKLCIRTSKDFYGYTRVPATRCDQYVWDAKTRTLLVQLPESIVGKRFIDDLEATIETQDDRDRAIG